MIRERKFRAWHKEQKIYYLVRLIDFEEGFITTYKNEKNGVYGLFEFNEVILEEYVGVKDKYGVDVYEGDVMLTESEDYIKKWVVEFNYGEFILFNGLNSFLRFSDVKLTIEDNCYVEDMVIVGNINENKELLK